MRAALLLWLSVCLLQISQHYILCIQMFTKSLGWHVLSLNNCIGVGDLEPIGNAVGAIIASPFHDKFVNFLLYFYSAVTFQACAEVVCIVQICHNFKSRHWKDVQQCSVNDNRSLWTRVDVSAPWHIFLLSVLDTYCVMLLCCSFTCNVHRLAAWPMQCAFPLKSTWFGSSWWLSVFVHHAIIPDALYYQMKMVFLLFVQYVSLDTFI